MRLQQKFEAGLFSPIIGFEIQVVIGIRILVLYFGAMKQVDSLRWSHQKSWLVYEHRTTQDINLSPSQ